ncbi:hypothetical protein DRE_01259 [Drechslerella stenobrocha 248]|uniref:Uncharacterized protein n=1 Tax=Drechslerella stenobrocha 248 TaxID=1043628 RepID=W7HV22_9PEZI|nr:hypothetical protein DRE_01259 [Drechslerella stenobrocha 248]
MVGWLILRTRTNDANHQPRPLLLLFPLTTIDRSVRIASPYITQSSSSPATDIASDPSGGKPRRPFTDPAYRSRYSDGCGSLSRASRRPVRRESVFVEQLDVVATATAPNGANHVTSHLSSTPASSPFHHRNLNLHNLHRPSLLAINPVKAKESYIMQLPVHPSRFSLLVLFLVACSTISLSTSAERDLDGLLKHVPGAGEGVVERREASVAPSFRIGPAVRNPSKDIPKLRTGLLVLGIGCLFAGLMT